MGILFGYVLIFLGGICAIIFSILASRLKQDVFFILGCIFTGIILIYVIYNYEWIWYLVNEGALFGLLILSFIVIPVIFLIQSKQSKSASIGDSEVTDSFLDDIIQSEEEDINFDEDIDDDDNIDFEK
ncbi:hypothetical protein JYT72_00260 [Crocinitomix catalasitica]|nr:hypothetical protein [Crocinitomix catalasitica]